MITMLLHGVTIVPLSGSRPMVEHIAPNAPAGGPLRVTGEAGVSLM